MINESYLIGDAPVSNPCEKCLLQHICSQICERKILFDKKEKKEYKKPNHRIKMRKKRRSKK